MSPAPTSWPELTNAAELAQARERFLTADEIQSNLVRDRILTSWQRSRQFNVAADHLEVSYVRDPAQDTPLVRSALPVLRNLRDTLGDQPISIILTDPTGVVLSRLTADRSLDRHLDSVQLAPGFSYAETVVGTNGIGTALEDRAPTAVFGHEHYAENLEDLACAAVPIHHPISGRTVGAVDLTCWQKSADPLLVALVKATGAQIEQQLLADCGGHDIELLQAYLRVCRYRSGIVFALNDDVVMMNDHARRLVEPGVQSTLLGRAAEALSGGHPATVVVELPDGIEARMRCRPVGGEGGHGGGVVLVQLLEPSEQRPATGGSAARTLLPGLVGSGPLWLRCCREVGAAFDSGDWLALQGEPGSGKLAVIQAVHRARRPAGRLRVLDALEATGQEWLTEARRELLEPQGSLVIRHVDALSDWKLDALSRSLQRARAQDGHGHPLWVAVTHSPVEGRSHLTELLRFFPSAVECPPLRHHIEDLRELVPFLLTRITRDSRLTCSPEAMQVLVRSSWPGNIAQLITVLRQVVQHRRTGAIQAQDLPAECRSVSRRVLSVLESIERDAIVAALADAGGNKAKAATSLGISRATIYRKIREYGIVTACGG